MFVKLWSNWNSDFVLDSTSTKTQRLNLNFTKVWNTHKHRSISSWNGTKETRQIFWLLLSSLSFIRDYLYSSQYCIIFYIGVFGLLIILTSMVSYDGRSPRPSLHITFLLSRHFFWFINTYLFDVWRWFHKYENKDNSQSCVYMYVVPPICKLYWGLAAKDPSGARSWSRYGQIQLTQVTHFWVNWLADACTILLDSYLPLFCSTTKVSNQPSLALGADVKLAFPLGL